MTTLEAFEKQEEATQRQAIADATAAGFVDCHAVFDALGFDQVNAGGMTRNSLEVADRWITDAGFTVVVIVRTARTTYPKPSGWAATPKTYPRFWHSRMPTTPTYRNPQRRLYEPSTTNS